jgi:hypothetical protein
MLLCKNNLENNPRIVPYNRLTTLTCLFRDERRKKQMDVFTFYRMYHFADVRTTEQKEETESIE